MLENSNKEGLLERVDLNKTIVETESSPGEKRVKESPWHLCHSRMEHRKGLNKIRERGLVMAESEESEEAKSDSHGQSRWKFGTHHKPAHR